MNNGNKFNFIFNLLIIGFLYSMLVTCDKNKSPSEPRNELPIPSFSVVPDTGATETIFSVDARSSSDNEDNKEILQVRWDWENDGEWDTDYTTEKIALHQYQTEGPKAIKLNVLDTGGHIQSATKNIFVTNEMGTLTDIDGNIYKMIKIGNQWWMAENLKVTKYRNGDVIPNVEIDSVWSNLTTGAYCNYNNDINNTLVYGCLYNWYAINGSRNIAPAGWHVPTDAEWKQLELYLGMSQTDADIIYSRGTNEGGKLKEIGTKHWQSPNNGATNASRFFALPSGWRTNYGSYESIGISTLYWTSTEISGYNYAWLRYLVCNESQVARNNLRMRTGCSIRCIKD